MSFLNKIIEWRRYQLRERHIRNYTPKLWLIEFNKLGYIPIHKVATTSIRNCLTQYVLEQEGNKEMAGNLTTQNVQMIEKQYAQNLSQKEMLKYKNDFTIFAFVRNPLARLYSCYKNKVKDLDHNKKRETLNHFGVTRDTEFDDFVKIICKVPDKRSDRHFRSQYCFLSTNGELVPQLIYKMENLEHGWDELMKKFSLPALSHRNKSSKASAVHKRILPYTKETFEIATERYKKDIEMFNYQEQIAVMARQLEV